MYPRQESNLSTWFRKPLLYPPELRGRPVRVLKKRLLVNRICVPLAAASAPPLPSKEIAAPHWTGSMLIRPDEQMTVIIAYHFLHLLVIVVNLFAWMFRETRRLHLLVVFLTLFSWIVLGWRFGFGYCFITDWHWQAMEIRGARGLPNSYIKYLVDLFTGWDSNPFWIDAATGISFAIAVICSLYVNRDLFADAGIRLAARLNRSRE